MNSFKIPDSGFNAVLSRFTGSQSDSQSNSLKKEEKVDIELSVEGSKNIQNGFREYARLLFDVVDGRQRHY